MDAETKIADVIANENFKGYGRLLFPGRLSESDKKRTLGQIAPLFPYHRHLSVGATLNVLNSMLAREKNGEKIFYDLYSDKEKAGLRPRRRRGCSISAASKKRRLPLSARVAASSMWRRSMKACRTRWN